MTDASITLKDLRERIGDVVHRVAVTRQRVVVTVRGRPTAVIAPLDQADGEPSGAGD